MYVSQLLSEYIKTKKINIKKCAEYFQSDSNVIMSQCIQVDNVPIGTLSTCRVKL